MGLIVENNFKIKCPNSQSITKFASLFAQIADDGYFIIDIGNCGTGGAAAGREDFLR